MTRAALAGEGGLRLHPGLTPGAVEAIEAWFGPLVRDGVTQAEVSEALRTMPIDAAGVRACSRFEPGRRVRCELARTPSWVLLAIFWEATVSEIHDHCESECGFRVLDGELEETRFKPEGEDLARPVATRTLRAGDFVTTPGCTVHQLGNPRDGGGRAISVHAYSPALNLDDMQVFERA